MVEYALILASVSVADFGILRTFGRSVSSIFGKLDDDLWSNKPSRADADL